MYSGNRVLQHIIDVHLHGVPDQVLEDFVYHSLEGCPCVLESEGHHLVAVDSLIGGESHSYLHTVRNVLSG